MKKLHFTRFQLETNAPFYKKCPKFQTVPFFVHSHWIRHNLPSVLPMTILLLLSQNMQDHPSPSHLSISSAFLKTIPLELNLKTFS